MWVAHMGPTSRPTMAPHAIAHWVGCEQKVVLTPFALVRSAYRLISVQAASCFKQSKDMPIRSRFYGRA